MWKPTASRTQVEKINAVGDNVLAEVGQQQKQQQRRSVVNYDAVKSPVSLLYITWRFLWAQDGILLQSNPMRLPNITHKPGTSGDDLDDSSSEGPLK